MPTTPYRASRSAPPDPVDPGRPPWLRRPLRAGTALAVSGLLALGAGGALADSGGGTSAPSSTPPPSQGQSQSAPAPSAKSAALLAAIAQCESGDNPRAVSRNGRYRGEYQFSRATWRALGGKGDPAKAPVAVQDRLAAQLLAQRGPSAWPACSKAIAARARRHAHSARHHR